MSAPGPSMAEASGPILAAFRNARTEEIFCEATMFFARHAVQSYFINSGDFTLIDHGPLPTPLKAEDGTEIAPSNTLLLEIRKVDTDTTRCVRLAAYVPIEQESQAIQAAVRRLSDICHEWKESRGLWNVFGVIIVRQKIVFVQCCGRMTVWQRTGTSWKGSGRWNDK